MTANREYWHDQADHEYLNGVYQGIVRESFRRENIASARKYWNRRAIIMAVIVVAGFVALIACRK